MPSHEWKLPGSDAGSVYEILFRTPQIVVARRELAGKVRIRVEAADLHGLAAGHNLPTPFELKSENHASATVKLEDARVALHRITDWAVSLQAAWPAIH